MMKKMLASLRDPRGLTLVESAIVLAIVAFVVAAVWIVAAAVNENARQHKFGQQLQQITQNVRQVYTRVNVATTGDRTTILDNQNVFPLEMRITRNTPGSGIHHPWAATSTVTVIFRGTAEFGVRLTAVPRSPCINLAVKYTGGDITGLNSFLINGAAVGTPVNTVNAATACTSATNNNMEWRFNIRG